MGPLAQLCAIRSSASRNCDEHERFFKAMAIWQEGVPIEGTPVEQYLRTHRKLDIPDGVSGSVLRYHPACPFGTTTHPCMVALVRNVETNAPQAIHRTALKPDGAPLKIDGKTRAWRSARPRTAPSSLPTIPMSPPACSSEKASKQPLLE